MMPPKKDTQKTEKGLSLEQSTHGQAELVTIDQKGKKDNVEGNGQASGQDQVGSTTEEEGQSLTDMGISDANDASVEADNPDSTIQPKNGQNQDGNGDEHFQVEPDDKNESGTDGNVELEEQPNHQGKPVDSTGQTHLTSTNNDNEKTPNTSVQTNTSNSHNESFPDYIQSKLTKGNRMKGSENKGKTALEPVTRPEADKKGTARGGKKQILGDDVDDKTNMQPLQPRDKSDDNDGTHNPSTKISEKDTGGADGGSKENGEGTGCTHIKTVWGLRLDVLLLAIVVVIAAVIVKLPSGAQQMVTENPAIQQQLSALAKQINEVNNTMKVLNDEVNNTMKVLNSEVNKYSDKHREQASKLYEIDTNINEINGILNQTKMLYPDLKTEVGKIRESLDKSHTYIATVEKDLKHNLSASITKQKQINYDFTKNISSIRVDVNADIEESSKFSVRIGDVESVTNKLESDLSETTNKVKGVEEKMKEAGDMVSTVEGNANTAKEMVYKANKKLEKVEQHLFNKDALTAAILILFFLIIGLMLYVLKLKSLLEPSLAGGSTYPPLKVSREMEVVLQKMPSRPTLDKAVCIVSFDASNMEEYKRMIKETVGHLRGVSFRTHVIRKHADIAELPHCRLYIMCVEFTERHVIIEEQGLGLGDLKLTSYRGVRKLGGALVILYIHDPGSRNLTDDQLYSDGVYCVKKQQELKELCEIDRFISAHKELNTAQKKALETAMSNVLNIKATRP